MDTSIARRRHADSYAAADTAAGLRFARRTRRMRALGLALALFAMAFGLHPDFSGPLAWTLLALTCVAWPHIAWDISRRSADPRRAELVNLQVDAVIGGAWIAAMGFNLLPSVLLLSMLWMGEFTAGGIRLLSRSLLLQALGACLFVGLVGARFSPYSDVNQVLACLPFLVVYPLAMSMLVRSLSQRVVRQKRQLENNARVDALTGLANRQHFERVATSIHARTQSRGGDATLLMIDVDGFKSVNDLEGHLAGDAILAAVAHALGDSVRAEDTPARYAGDEFIVVVPDAPLSTGIDIAERIRAAVAALPPGASGRRCSVSIGAAKLDDSMPALRDWIHAADQALYRSKRAGRNRVTAAENAVVPFRRVERLA